LEDWTAELMPNPRKMPLILITEQRDKSILKKFLKEMDQESKEEAASLVAQYCQPEDYRFFAEHANYISSELVIGALHNSTAMLETIMEQHHATIQPFLEEAIDQTTNNDDRTLLQSCLRKLKKTHSLSQQNAMDDSDDSDDDRSMADDSDDDRSMTDDEEDIASLFGNPFNSFASHFSSDRPTGHAATASVVKKSSSISDLSESESESDLFDSEDEHPRTPSKNVNLHRLSSIKVLHTPPARHHSSDDDDLSASDDDDLAPGTFVKPSHNPGAAVRRTYTGSSLEGEPPDKKVRPNSKVCTRP
jgi:hypothetical protein